MIVTGPEACTVTKRILETHIGAAFAGLRIDHKGAVEIGVADMKVLGQAAVDLGLDSKSPIGERWRGTVTGIDVTLRLDIPLGVFPARAVPTQRAGA